MADYTEQVPSFLSLYWFLHLPDVNASWCHSCVTTNRGVTSKNVSCSVLAASWPENSSSGKTNEELSPNMQTDEVKEILS